MRDAGGRLQKIDMRGAGRLSTRAWLAYQWRNRKRRAMSHITLIRHGQANSQAKDEISYDQLSDLGRQQARWLGDHLRGTGDVFARAYSGHLLVIVKY